MKVWKSGDSNLPYFPETYKVIKRWEGNQTNIIKNSNKFYHAEIQVAPDKTARIFTMYGRVGKTPAKEYRYYSSENACMNDYESLIRKKRDRKKDPYREIDLAITSVGSDKAKEIKKPMTGIDVKIKQKTNLHNEVQRLILNWFGATGNFITMTLKCPLGQLTKEQIDKGRLILDDCKTRINSKLNTDDQSFDQLTSQFYSLIPHVLPHKIDPNNLRLNSLDRIMAKHDTLDTFLDAKNVESFLGGGISIDEQYKKLNSNLGWMDPADPVHKWIEFLVHKTRAKNHSFLGNIKIHNIFSLKRNMENEYFIGNVNRIGNERKLKSWIWPDMLRSLGPERCDLEKDMYEIYKKANVIPLFHGTRNENMVGITTRGLLIRPSGAIHTGSAFGDGCYWAPSSSKSIGYSSCSGSYWAKGNNKRGFLFLADVCLGDQKVVKSSSYYTFKNIIPYHSVWAKSGGYLINDELITYYPSGINQQHQLNYIIELETQAK